MKYLRACLLTLRWQCYYMLGVKRTVSKDMKQGVSRISVFFGGTDRVLLQAPAEIACKRYTAADDSICELRFRELIVVINESPHTRFQFAQCLSWLPVQWSCLYCLIDWMYGVAKKLDASMNLEKMRVKELRHLMQEYEVECINCLEKSDMIKRIRETIMKPTKEL